MKEFFLFVLSFVAYVSADVYAEGMLDKLQGKIAEFLRFGGDIGTVSFGLVA